MNIYAKQIPRTGPDSWQSWRAACLIGSIYASAMFTLSSMGSYYVRAINEWNTSREMASWLSTSFIVFSQVFTPLFPLFLKYFSVQTCLRVSTFGSAFFLIIGFWAKDINQISVVLGGHGFCIGGVYLFASMILMQHFQEKRCAASGFSSFLSTSITIFAPKLMLMFFDSYGLTGGTFCHGLLMIGSAIAAFFVSTPSWYSHPEVCVKSKESSGASSQKSKSILGNFLTLVYVIDVFTTVVTYGNTNFFYQIALDNAEDRGLPKSLGEKVIPMFAAGGISARVLSGFMIDSGIMAWKSFFLMAFSLEALGFVALKLTSDANLMLGSAFVIGCTTGSRSSLLPVMFVNDFGVQNFASTFAWSSAVSGLVSVVRPEIVGYFRDNRGSYDGLFLVIASMNAFLSIVWSIRCLLDRKSHTYGTVRLDDSADREQST